MGRGILRPRVRRRQVRTWPARRDGRRVRLAQRKHLSRGRPANKLAAEYPVAPGAHELRPDFTGYGAWMLVTARKGPAEVLTALYACEDSCHRAFTVVRDARPLADAGALTHDAAVRAHRRAGELGLGPPSARWVRWPVLPGFFPVLASVPPAPAIAATGALA